MSSKKKHWSELGRVKNSDWFKNLPEIERACILEALEVNTHESAVKLRATLAFIYLTVIYAVAIAVWGPVFHGHILWFGACGAVVGAIVGFLSAIFIARQKTPHMARSAQATVGFPMGLGVLIAVAGCMTLLLWKN